MKGNRRNLFPATPLSRVTAHAPAAGPAHSPVGGPGPRGWPGRGGGSSAYVHPPAEWRATTVQACGLWPFAAGSGAPMVGVPLGRLLPAGGAAATGSFCCDPVSWFWRAGLTSNPSEFVLGLPGLGKSSLVRRQALGLAGYGVLPLILGDLKPDYVDLITALGGQVITLGRGRGYLNILDPGEATDAARRLSGTARTAVLADAHGRRLTMVAALLTILRTTPPTDREESILDRALHVLDDRHPGVPVIADLLAVIRDAPDDVRAVAIDRGSLPRYQQITEALEASLIGMCGSGRLGELFSRPTTVAMRRDRPVVFDVSAIDDTQTDLQAAALLACWSTGFGALNVGQALTDAGLEPQRHYFVVLDELWRALRAGRGMVDRADALTRLNRNIGVGQAYISHTMSDLEALAEPADRAKARGFVERSGLVIAGGLPAAEMPMLSAAVKLSAAEQTVLTSWTSPPAWDSSGAEPEPPGRGSFLAKVGGRPGIPFHVDLTAAETGLHDTNKRWTRTTTATTTASPGVGG